jgi:hypothetical protein
LNVIIDHQIDEEMIFRDEVSDEGGGRCFSMWSQGWLERIREYFDEMTRNGWDHAVS